MKHALALFISCLAVTAHANFLNPQDAIIVSVGHGTRKIAIFEDPNCGFCKGFEGQLAKLNDVTMYIYLYPLLGEDSVAKSTAIWCANTNNTNINVNTYNSPNTRRVQAWQGWMRNFIAPTPALCPTPLARNIALGRSLGMQGTPAIVFEDGSKHTGIMSYEEIEKKFSTLYPSYRASLPSNATHPTNTAPNAYKTGESYNHTSPGSIPPSLFK